MCFRRKHPASNHTKILLSATRHFTAQLPAKYLFPASAAIRERTASQLRSDTARKALRSLRLCCSLRKKNYTHENWLSRVRSFQIDYGQEEAKEIFGADPREYCILMKKFVGDDDGNLKGLETVNIEWKDGRMQEIKDSEKFWNAENVFLATGFVGVEKLKLFEDLGINLSDKNTICTGENKQMNIGKIFAAGDCERGQSLIVWAIADGRRAASGVDKFFRPAENN